MDFNAIDTIDNTTTLLGYYCWNTDENWILIETSENSVKFTNNLYLEIMIMVIITILKASFQCRIIQNFNTIMVVTSFVLYQLQNCDVWPRE